MFLTRWSVTQEIKVFSDKNIEYIFYLFQETIVKEGFFTAEKNINLLGVNMQMPTNFHQKVRTPESHSNGWSYSA